jgi:hypothetical protein
MILDAPPASIGGHVRLRSLAPFLSSVLTLSANLAAQPTPGSIIVLHNA